jgi:type VI secretion system protein ImpL
MASVIAFLGSRWFLSAVGAALLALVVWFFGPLVGLLHGTIVRAAIVLAILLVWLAANLWIDRRRRQKDAALEKGVAAGTAVDPAIAASAEEVAALKEKLTTALGLLRKARGSRGYLYEQPWYVIIGPPGAGKTTALLNSGLKFPLAAEMGQGALGGVGGTRLCEWWFTEQAVLIDTAGRYTTQDSDVVVDRAGWESFLDLLKRTRSRQPLNGVIVAIAIPDIATASEPERLLHARAIRKRVKEITERLGIRVPVYALFTKADLLAGFTEFYDDLDREKRAQVWGTTFPLGENPSGPGAGFREAFGLLVERLNGRLFERLQAERSPERRALIAGFPAQAASLGEPLEAFLQEAFGGSRLDPAPFLRGVYLTSGTQEGTPIDRLTAALARTFGVDQRHVPSLRPERGRSYFLGRLLTDVVFNEAMLVAANPRATRRRLLFRSGAFALIGIAVIGIASALFSSRAANQAAIAKSDAAIAAYDKAARGIKLDPVADADLPPIAPLLDQARDLPFGYAAQHAPGGLPAVGGFGLSQADKLGTAARLIYRHALERILLPRLLYRLETEMRGSLDRPDFLYEATRVYLMLGNQGPLDPSLVRAWMALDWQTQYPGPSMVPVRADLLAHLDALLAEPLPSVALDGTLVATARSTFSRVPLAARVYSRIRPSAPAEAVPPWTPAEALGAAGAGLFQRSSGKPLTEGIPGFFTATGFHSVLLPALGNVAKEVASESWVLGKNQTIDPNSPEMRTLEQDVIRLYEADYARQWNAMLADLELAPAPFGNLSRAVQTLYVLSSPQSPMLTLLQSVAHELQLSAAPPVAAGAAAGAVPGAAGGVAGAVTSKLGVPGAAATQLQGLFSTKGGPPPPPPGAEIDQRYKTLIAYVGHGAGAPIGLALQIVNQMQQQLAQLSQSQAAGAPPTAISGGDPEQLLSAEAARAPEPVARWLATLASSANVLRGGGARQQVAAAFGSPGGPGPFCQTAVGGRYPFFAGSSEDIPLGDFGRLFAPGGLLDSFFNSQILPFVDTASPTWKLKAVNGVAPPISAGDLAEFQRASVIRNLFFAAGGAQPSVSFTITPVSLDDQTQRVTLAMGGTTVAYAHGPPQPTAITWPGPSGMDLVRLTFDPPPPGGTGVLQATGPWALFRLFGQGTLRQEGAPERFNLTFQAGQQRVEYAIRAASVFNPFSPGVLQAFRCPGVQ